jgi:transcriptional regulator of heat shock response
MDIQSCISFFNKYLCDTPLCEINNKLKYLDKIGKKFVYEHEEIIQKLINIIINNIKPHNTISGLDSIVNRDEYHDYEKFSRLIKLLNDKSIWKIIKKPENSDKILLSIGKEISTEIQDIATITKNYSLKSGKKGQLVFLGPQRLNYSNLYGLLD